MNFLSYIVVEISLTKIVERKKKEHIQGKLELSENLTIPPLKRFQSIWLVSLTKNVERKKNTGKNK